ncbi:MAG: tetratricopeptide repeat protein [Deferribacterota bacterium]|nr:tetratricopeptide repeat protein [Deferribacterota bacterium]
MRYILIFLLIITGCLYKGVGYSESESQYSDYLKASYLYNSGDLDKALIYFKKLDKSSDSAHIKGLIANIYINQGRFTAAKNILLEGIKKHKDPDLYFKLGILYGKIYDNCNEALSYLEKAISLKKDAKYLLATAECYENIGEYVKALDVYDSLLKKNENPLFHYRKGIIYTKLNMFEQAKKEYMKAIEVGDHLKSYLNLSEIYIIQKNYDEAIGLLKKVIDDFGDILVAKKRLAEIYSETGENKKALELFTSIIDKLDDENKAKILKEIGFLYLNNNKYDKAYEYFKKVLEIQPSDYQTLYFIAFISELNKNYKRAEEYYLKALEIRKDFAFAKKRLAVTYINEGKFEEAEDMLESIDNASIDVDYYLIKSLLYKKMDKIDNALDILLKAKKEYPASLEVLFELASIYEMQKEYDKCENILKEALALEPENPIFLNFLGYLYAELGKNLDEAYKLINKALEKDPDNPAYIDSLAWVLYKQKRYKEAYKLQKKALRSNPSEEEFVKHMNSILKAMGSDETIDEIINEK